MALRCPRCQKNEIVLETFGVYRCPACGRIDADGHLLDPVAPASAAAVTFAAPPAREWTPPGAPARPAAPTTTSGTGPPAFFSAMVFVIGAIVILVGALSSTPVRAMFKLGFLVPLFTGRPWARRWAIGGAMLTAVTTLGLLAVFSATTSGALRVLLVAEIALQGVWLYALLRPDTVAYFARTR